MTLLATITSIPFYSWAASVNMPPLNIHTSPFSLFRLHTASVRTLCNAVHQPLDRILYQNQFKGYRAA